MSSMMKQAAKYGVGLAALVVGLVFAAELRASIVTVNPNSNYTTYVNAADGSFGSNPAWESDPTIRSQDKDWTFISSSPGLPSGTTATFNKVTHPQPTTDLHTLTLSDLNGSTLPGPPNSYSLDYSIVINNTGSPDLRIFRASLSISTDDSIANLGAWSVTEKLYSDPGLTNLITTLSLSSSVPPEITDPTSVSKNIPDQTAIYVVETWSLPDGGSDLPSTTNQFTEGIPEPASLAVWTLLGAGAAGMALRRRRSGGRWSAENRQAIHAMIESKLHG